MEEQAAYNWEEVKKGLLSMHECGEIDLDTYQEALRDVDNDKLAYELRVGIKPHLNRNE